MSDMRDTGTRSAEIPAQTRGQDEKGAPAEESTSRDRHGVAPQPTRWVGWIVFAAVMMIMVGSFQVIEGLTALFNSGFYLVGEEDLLVSVDYTAWGWTHLLLGALALAAAFGLLAGQMWARVVGIAMAMVSSIVHLAFIDAYPVWSIIVITIDVLIIYAIAMHGEEARAI